MITAAIRSALRSAPAAAPAGRAITPPATTGPMLTGDGQTVLTGDGQPVMP